MNRVEAAEWVHATLLDTIKPAVLELLRERPELVDVDDLVARCFDVELDSYSLREWVSPETLAQAALQYPGPLGRTLATSLPCPDWCTRISGHAFETTDLEGPDLPEPDAHRLFRVHRRRMGEKPIHAAVETIERSTSSMGPSDLGTDCEATLVRLQLPDGSKAYLTAAGARRLSKQLLDAAEVVDRELAQGLDT